MIAPTTFNPVAWSSQAIRPLLPQVSIAITSTLFSVFGSEINGWFRNIIRKQAFAVRVFAYVMLVAFGYGAVNLLLAHQVSQLLMGASDVCLAPVVLLVFVGLGLVAEEKRQI